MKWILIIGALLYLSTKASASATVAASSDNGASLGGGANPSVVPASPLMKYPPTKPGPIHVATCPPYCGAGGVL